MGNQFDADDDGVDTIRALDMPVLLLQDGNHLTLTIPTGTPAELTVNLTITSSPANRTSSQSIVIPVGHNRATFTLTPEPGQTQRAVFAATNPFLHPDLSNIEFGEFVGRVIGICSRSPAVQTAIIARVPATNCATVTDDMLYALTGTLDLVRDGINALRPHDFNMLTGLQGINLANNRLTTLPEGIFTDLTSLTSLNLSINRLSANTPADHIFAPLPALADLDLRNNRFETLPDGIFAGLALPLTNLDLRSQNDLSGNPLGHNLQMKLLLDWASGGTSTARVDVPAGVPAPLAVPISFTDTEGIKAAVVNVPSSATTQSLELSPVGAATLAPGATAPSWASGSTVRGLNFTFGICDRTAQVQAAIVARVSATACGAVTDAMLKGISGTLDLSGKTITRLQADDFAGLPNITYLNLSENNLTALPVGVFSGLTAVSGLNLQDNEIATMAAGVFNTMPLLTQIDLSNNALTALPRDLFRYRTTALEELDLSDQFDEVGSVMDIPVIMLQFVNHLIMFLREGAPADVTVNLTVTSSPSNEISTQSVVIPAGDIAADLRLYPAPGETQHAVLASSDPFSHSSLTLLGARFVGQPIGICARSPAVQTKLLAVIPGSTNCQRVNIEHLTAITGTLDLSGADLSALRPHDFNDLTGLTGLNLSDNQLAALPTGLFADLTAVTKLDLSGNHLSASALAAGALETSAFAPLTALVELDLRDNRIDSLPDGIFTGLTLPLTTLDLRSQNDLNGNPLSGNLQMNLILTADATSNTVALDVPTGVPAALTVPLTVTDSAGSESQTLTVPTGGTSIAAQTLLSGDVVVASSRTPSWASGTSVQGLDFNFTFGICDRTMQVQSVLIRRVRLLTAVDSDINCGGVTDAMLAMLGTGLSDDGAGGSDLLNLLRNTLRDEGLTPITALKANDFAGLSNIDILLLNSNDLTDLPAGVFNGLTSVTGLSLGANKIATIAPGVFHPMPSLAIIDLAQNALATLPKDLFTGQTTGITDIGLGNQFDDSDDGVPTQQMMDIPVLLTQDGNHLTLTVPAGAPNNLTVNLTITSSPANTTSTQSIVIPTGQTSGTATLMPAPGETQRADFAASNTFRHPGLTNLTDGRFVGRIVGICNRSAAVQTAIIAAPQVTATTCNTVSDDMLRAITGTLDLSGASLSALRAGDFDMLTGLQQLNLSGNSLTALPAGIFADLTALTKLDLSGNHLTAGTLSAGAFAPLTALVELDLRDNRLETLPDGIFAGLTLPLTNLDLRNQKDLSGNLQLNLILTADAATNTVAMNVPAGVPAALTVPLTVTDTGGAVPLTLTVPLGGTTVSGAITVANDASLTSASTPSWASGTSVQGLDFNVTFGICDRTMQVRSVLLTRVRLLTAVDSNINCGGVTDAMLAMLGTGRSDDGAGGSDLLHLTRNNLRDEGLTPITALKANDFAGLSNIATLLLNSNDLTDLPAGVFNGLTSVSGLSLGANKIATIAPRVFHPMPSLAIIDLAQNALTTLPKDLFTGQTTGITDIGLGNQFDDADDGVPTQTVMDIPVLLLQDGNHLTLTVPTGALNALTVNLTITSSPANTTSTQSIVIPTGQTTATATLMPAPGETQRAAFAASNTFRHPGLTALTDGRFVGRIVGICNRSTAVQTAIIAAPQVTATTCNLVSDDMLRAVTGTLDLSGSLSALRAGDFDLLTALTGLNLSGNALAALPAGIFADLGAVTTLDLSGNRLSATDLPAGALASLTALVELDLRDNRLETLPDGIFDGLTLPLTNLDLRHQKDSGGNPLGDNLQMSLILRWASGGTSTAIVDVPAGVPAPLAVPIVFTDTESAKTAVVNVPAGATTQSLALSPVGAATLAPGATAPSWAATSTVQGLDFSFGICDRTAQVQTAIISRVSATTCGGVTDAMLKGISGTLDLSGKTITQLQADDFVGLSGITHLNLSDNSLTDLPAGVFNGLTAVNGLSLQENKIATIAAGVFNPMPLQHGVDLSKNALSALPNDLFTGRTTEMEGLALPNQFDDSDDNIATQPVVDIPVFLIQSGNHLTLSLASGAPATLTMSLTITSSPANTTSTQSIVIPVGQTTATATLTPVSGQTLSADFTSSNTFSHSSLTLEGGRFVGRILGICDRSAAVQTALLAKVTATTCEIVTDDMLRAITDTLDLSDNSLNALLPHDFTGLTGLTGLNLSGNALAAGALPAGIFADLTAVTKLDLSGNDLAADALTASAFAPLTALVELDLRDNRLGSLPDGIFADLALPLTNLDLRSQQTLSGNLQMNLILTADSTTNTVAVEVPAGVPAALTVPLTVTDDSGTQAQTLTLPLGATGVTGALTLMGDVTVASASTPSWASGTTVRGLDFAFGICDRTSQVQTALLFRISRLDGVDSDITCGTVTDSMLARVGADGNSTLNLSGSQLESNSLSKTHIAATQRFRRAVQHPDSGAPGQRPDRPAGGRLQRPHRSPQSAPAGEQNRHHRRRSVQPSTTVHRAESCGERIGHPAQRPLRGPHNSNGDAHSGRPIRRHRRQHRHPTGDGYSRAPAAGRQPSDPDHRLGRPRSPDGGSGHHQQSRRHNPHPKRRHTGWPDHCHRHSDARLRPKAGRLFRRLRHLQSPRPHRPRRRSFCRTHTRHLQPQCRRANQTASGDHPHPDL